MLVNRTEGARDLREFCKYGYDCQAKGREWASRPTSTPSPKTNKQFCFMNFDSKVTLPSYRINLKVLFEGGYFTRKYGMLILHSMVFSKSQKPRNAGTL